MSQFTIGIAAGNLPPTVPTQFTTDVGGPVIPNGHNVNVLGGTGAQTSGSGSTITVNVKTDGFIWSEQNGNFNAANQNGYFCNAALTATLPVTVGEVIGGSIIFFIDTASQVVIQANTGELIQIGNMLSTSGGTATSNSGGACVELVFKPSDATWHAIASMGSWTTA